MAWYSVLPSHLTVYETWIIRTFIILAIINISPWFLLIIYDFFLYLFRTARHEIPVYGGRARGEIRPRAPSLVGRTRRISFAEMLAGRGGGLESEGEGREWKARGKGSEFAIEEED